MANRGYTPVMFALEKDVVFLSARVTFNANGIPVLDANNSKGICAVKNETVAFSAATTTSSSFLGTVSSFRGIYPGMTVVGSTGALGAGVSVVETRTPAGAITISSFPLVSSNPVNFFASGGRLRFQFGTQEATRLDPYVKIMGASYVWHMTTSSFGITQAQLIPAAPDLFVVDNRITTRTIPATAPSGSTDASIAVQFGQTISSGTSAFFRAGNPGNGEILHVVFVLSKSTAR